MIKIDHIQCEAGMLVHIWVEMGQFLFNLFIQYCQESSATSLNQFHHL